MKKRLLCLGLIFALVFCFAACSNTQSFTYVPCKILHWEISESVDTDTQLQERIFSMTELQDSIEYKRNSSPFEQFNKDFFKDKSLLIYRLAVPHSDGEVYLSYAYTLNNGKSVTVNAWYVSDGYKDAGNVLMLIELNRDNYKNIDVNVRFEHLDFTDCDVLFFLTKEATDETIFHDYTIEDFSEVDAESIEEIDGRTSETSGLTYRVRQCLLEDPTGNTIPFHLRNYTRVFRITLAEKSKENVLRTIDILLRRDDIKTATPNHIYEVD